MSKRYRMLMGLTALVLISCVSATSCTPTRSPVELHVGPGREFCNIQAAIAAAYRGDTVIVHAGTYDENIIVLKSLTIRSTEGAAATTIKAEERSQPVVIINTDFARLEGFTITGSNNEGVYLLGSHNHVSNSKVIRNRYGVVLGSGRAAIDSLPILAAACSRITNNVIVDNRDYGLQLNGAGMHHISRNTIRNSEVGIELTGLWETRNMICGNIIEACAIGINVQSRENLILANSVAHNRCGIKIHDWNNKVLGNTIQNNASMASGIHITEWGGIRENCNVLCWNNIMGNSPTDSVSYGVFNGGKDQIYAVQNWWGAAAGPTQSDNPTGIGDSVTNHVLYKPWLVKPYVPLAVHGQDPTVTTSDVRISFDTAGESVSGSLFVWTYPASPPSPMVSYIGTPGKVLKCFDIHNSGFDANSVSIQVRYTDNELDAESVDETLLRMYICIGGIWLEAKNSQVDSQQNLVYGSIGRIHNEHLIEGALAYTK